MIFKKISKILLISLILSNLSSCGSNNNKKTLNNAPYYSITITSYEKLRNDYIDVDVKIPKIIYTSTKSNAFVESLNNKIKNDVTAIVEEAKKNAKNNYTQNNRPDKKPFTNKEDRPERPFRASNSDIKKFRGEFPNTEETVTGFTNSDNLIIPGLHNKNIIVVETTTKESTEATEQSKRRSERIMPSESGDFGDFGDFKNRGETKQKENTKHETVVSQEGNDIITDKRDKDNDFSNNTPDMFRATSKNITTITCDYTIFCLDSEYISLNVSVNVYGKNSETKNLFYNVDLKNKKILTIKDMLSDKNKEVDENSTFFINSNHIAVMVDDNANLSTIPQ